MTGLYRNVGATHSRGASVPVFRGGAWTHDTAVLRDDVFAPTPVELARFAYKFRPVDARSLPPIPGSEQGEGDSAIEDGNGDAVDHVEDEPIDVELYRVEGTDLYQLPMGEVVGREEAMRLITGVSDGNQD